MALPLSSPAPARIAASPAAWRDREAARTRRAVALAGAGVTPVSLIAASTFGVGLRAAALAVLVPALALVAALAAGDRPTAGLVRRAVVAGVVATALYDASRFGFLAAGVVDRDPIPHIGVELGLAPPAVFGYLWRYLGNGVGLALAFLALGLSGRTAGVLYGLAVCGGLLVTLAVSPHGEELLFPLGPGTVVMATVGHALFGAALGGRAAVVGSERRARRPLRAGSFVNRPPRARPPGGGPQRPLPRPVSGVRAT